MEVFLELFIPVVICISGIYYFWKLSKEKELRLEKEMDDILHKDPYSYKFNPNIKLDYHQLVYVATEEDEALTSYFEQLTKGQWNVELAFGFEIVYLPNLAKHLSSKDIIEYYAPYLDKENLKRIEVGNDFLLQYLVDPSDKKGIKHYVYPASRPRGIPDRE